MEELIKLSTEECFGDQAPRLNVMKSSFLVLKKGYKLHKKEEVKDDESWQAVYQLGRTIPKNRVTCNIATSWVLNWMRRGSMKMPKS